MQMFEYLFPHSNDKFYQQHYPLYETFQKYVRQLRTDICQTHHTLWNDGVDRTTKNQLKLNLNYLDQLFQCIFHEEKGERLLMEKNIQTFASYCFQGFIHILIEKKMKLVIDVETTMVLIRMENNEEIERNDIEEFDETLNYLKKFFDVLNIHLLSRVMKIQTSKEK
ncbi:unnamed protein product [Rotaria sp. Silwood1]|nr:unnamed protein product [Rotaria sp. Silwood1]